MVACLEVGQVDGERGQVALIDKSARRTFDAAPLNTSKRVRYVTIPAQPVPTAGCFFKQLPECRVCSREGAFWVLRPVALDVQLGGAGVRRG